MRWDEINEKGGEAVRGRWRIESAQLSPDGRHLAACAEVRGFLGLKSRYVGIVYSLADKALVGHAAKGRRNGQDWKLA
jgi:hypothetical protein